MYKVSLFYRDANNYKCNFDVEVDNEVLEGLLDEGQTVQDLVELEYPYEQEIRIDEDLGLDVYDNPMIKEYGYHPDYDHNLVAITAIKEVDNEKIL